jgi:phage host-nuclease inhibitor protein Gam
MSKSKNTRVKAAAQGFVCQTRDQAVDAIAEIGKRQRERDRIQAAMNDEIAAIKKRYEEQAEPHGERITELADGVQTWAEAHRAELTDGGKVKTAQLPSGELRWRLPPPSVSIKGSEMVIEKLQELRLSRFLRERIEIDKEAILADQDAVASIKGITIKQDEQFEIVPFETRLQKAA